ncbi:hypothetical protein NLJ89_g9667 [Agrocybe chaxingu]|uniref:Uncharacterized protein n=1 Tax=Agrocybe chaxingu TaxID=84603 RepID=A0A9W8MRL6_9AGAR|nr:hypothetical protein NLJ89_g9667 [Agrocybe chaxingu]
MDRQKRRTRKGKGQVYFLPNLNIFAHYVRSSDQRHVDNGGHSTSEEFVSLAPDDSMYRTPYNRVQVATSIGLSTRNTDRGFVPGQENLLSATEDAEPESTVTDTPSDQHDEEDDGLSDYERQNVHRFGAFTLAKERVAIQQDPEPRVSQDYEGPSATKRARLVLSPTTSSRAAELSGVGSFIGAPVETTASIGQVSTVSPVGHSLVASPAPVALAGPEVHPNPGAPVGLLQPAGASIGAPFRRATAS